MPNRLEREIEDILIRLDEFVPNERRSRRMRRRLSAGWRAFGGRFGSLTRGISGGHVVLGAAVMLVALLFLSRVLPPVAVRWLTYGCLAVLFGAIFLSIRPLRRNRPNRYWRGQPLDAGGPNTFTRLQSWWRRRNRRR